MPVLVHMGIVHCLCSLASPALPLVYYHGQAKPPQLVAAQTPKIGGR